MIRLLLMILLLAAAPAYAEHEPDLNPPGPPPGGMTREEWLDAIKDHHKYGDQRYEEFENSLPDCPPLMTEEEYQALAKSGKMLSREETVRRANEHLKANNYKPTCIDKGTKDAHREVREQRRLRRLEHKEQQQRERGQ